MSVQLIGIFKSYDSKSILKDINLSIQEGSIYCLLGKNGAGKSTLLNILLDLVQPNKGNLLIFDMIYEKSPIGIKKVTGSVIESVPIIEDLTAMEYLIFVSLLYEIPEEIAFEKIIKLFEFFFDSEEISNKKISSFSTGMKKKIALCASLLNNPKLLIWDEPFTGLDPIFAQKLVDFIKFYTSSERIILVASHDLPYVNQIATHIGILDNQKLVFNDTFKEFSSNKDKNFVDEIKNYLSYTETDFSSLSLLKT